MSPPTELPDPDEFDFEDGETSVGTDLFGTQQVPDYPVLSQLGRYEILGRIARGGMAEVYLARCREDDGSVRHVVVKRVLTELQRDPAILQMFLEEGHIAHRLFHPNICHVYESGEVDGRTFMALEWVHGTSLREAVQRAGPRGALPLPVVAHVIARVADALEYVHHATGIDGRPLSIIHQDVTPHNVMINWRGQVKLLDFGIAKTAAQAKTGAATPQGKYEYMSPEQVRGAPIDARSDVFALGVCLYEGLASRSLYGRDGGMVQVMTAIVEGPVPSARAVRPDVPRELDVIVQKALAKRPEERWASAGEMARALDAWIASKGTPVADVRVAMSIGSLYSVDEKTPLPKHAAQLTGALPAMTDEQANELLDPGGGWAESFRHDDFDPPAPIAAFAPPPATRAPVPPARSLPPRRPLPPAPGLRPPASDLGAPAAGASPFAHAPAQAFQPGASPFAHAPAPAFQPAAPGASSFAHAQAPAFQPAAPHPGPAATSFPSAPAATVGPLPAARASAPVARWAMVRKVAPWAMVRKVALVALAVLGVVTIAAGLVLLGVGLYRLATTGAL